MSEILSLEGPPELSILKYAPIGFLGKPFSNPWNLENLFLKALDLRNFKIAQMVDFLTKPFQNMHKINRAKGVALKPPNI